MCMNKFYQNQQAKDKAHTGSLQDMSPPVFYKTLSPPSLLSKSGKTATHKNTEYRDMTS